MILSTALLSLLVTINVVAVLCLILNGGPRPEAVLAGGASQELDPSLHALVEEVEATAAARESRSRAEAELEESLNRWRRHGSLAPPTASSCRLEHTA